MRNREGKQTHCSRPMRGWQAMPTRDDVARSLLTRSVSEAFNLVMVPGNPRSRFGVAGRLVLSVEQERRAVDQGPSEILGARQPLVFCQLGSGGNGPTQTLPFAVERAVVGRQLALLSIVASIGGHRQDGGN